MSGDLIDKRLSFIISIQVFLLGAKNSLIEGLPFLFFINDILNLIIMAFIGLLYVYALFISKSRHLPIGGMLFWLFIAASYLFTILFFPNNVYYIKGNAIRVIPLFFITSILISKLRSLEFLEKYMTIFAYPTIIAGVISGIFISLIGHVTTSEYEGTQYAMSLSYAVLVSVMWLLRRFFKSGGFLPFSFSVVGIIVILLYGSRNPLLAIFFYVAIELWDKADHDKIHGAFYKVLLVCGVIMAIFYKTIIRALADISASFGFNSRTLAMLSADEIDMSNRDVIHERIWQVINANPLMGTGIHGDVATIGEYAHGLYISIWCTYGYIIGTLFMLILGVWLINSLRHSKGLNHQILVLYICLVLPRGFTSVDMWRTDVFWWLVALLFFIQFKKFNSCSRKLAYKDSYCY